MCVWEEGGGGVGGVPFPVYFIRAFLHQLTSQYHPDGRGVAGKQQETFQPAELPAGLSLKNGLLFKNKDLSVRVPLAKGKSAERLFTVSFASVKSDLF